MKTNNTPKQREPFLTSTKFKKASFKDWQGMEIIFITYLKICPGP